MSLADDPQRTLDPEERDFYCQTLAAFANDRLDILVGGAYAFGRYTGIERHTKDFDVFVRESDFYQTLRALEKAGYATEVPFPHWLGKAHCGEYFVDVIHSSGNGLTPVDDEWFVYSRADCVFDVPVKLVPPEEMIWSKAFIQERERVPGWVMRELLRRLEAATSAAAPPGRLCRGTLLSRQQYLIDVEQWSYLDARALHDNPMSEDDIAVWTAAIANDGSKNT